MRVQVNGARLFFDVEGAGLVPDGPSMRSKPTLLLLHGGPGADHSLYKPYFSRFADVAQVVYLDHRGNGRSDARTSAEWNLKQWADDVRAFCEALDIERPIIYGASFGGYVALAYATQYPEHPAALILSSTEAWGPGNLDEKVALFNRLGGPAVGALAHRRFIDGCTDRALMDDWLRLAMPVYKRTGMDPQTATRVVRRAEVTQWFMRADGESHAFDFRPQLSRIRCPTLVMGGTEDPMTPISAHHEIAAGLPRHLVRFEAFSDCGHGLPADAPSRFEAVLRGFLAEVQLVNAAATVSSVSSGSSPAQ